MSIFLLISAIVSGRNLRKKPHTFFISFSLFLHTILSVFTTSEKERNSSFLLHLTLTRSQYQQEGKQASIIAREHKWQHVTAAYVCEGVRHLIRWFHLAVVSSLCSALTPLPTSCLLVFLVSLSQFHIHTHTHHNILDKTTLFLPLPQPLRPLNYMV